MLVAETSIDFVGVGHFGSSVGGTVQYLPFQSSYGSWETWKVTEFYNIIFRPVKSWNLSVGHGKALKMTENGFS